MLAVNTRLIELSKAAREAQAIAARASVGPISQRESLQFDLSLALIELHLQAIRAEIGRDKPKPEADR